MKKYTPIYLLLLLAVFMTSAVQVHAGDGGVLVWDSAVSRLLAAGMYGAEGDEASRWSVRLKNDPDFYKGFITDSAAITGQRITLSYGGSSGLLSFSAGYIYTSQGDEIENNFTSVFLGSYDLPEFTADDIRGAWHIALGLSSSYSLRNDISVGVGGEAMFINAPYAFQDGKGAVLSLNLPVSYKKHITITPEVQWSGSLSGLERLLPLEGHADEELWNDDVFFGGVSITFSY